MIKLVIGIGIAVVAMGAFAAGLMDPIGAKAMITGADRTGQATAPADSHETAKPERRGLMYSTKERVVNLADTGGFRYLKTEIVLELELPAKEAENLKGEAYKKRQEELAKEMAPLAPVIDDAITTVLTTKRSTELLTEAGKAALRDELRERLGPIFHEHPLKGIYLAQFIIQ